MISRWPEVMLGFAASAAFIAGTVLMLLAGAMDAADSALDAPQTAWQKMGMKCSHAGSLSGVYRPAQYQIAGKKRQPRG